MTKPLAERLRGADLHEPHCGSCADEPWPCDCNAPSLIAEIRAALENGAGWVSVEERLPEIGTQVLVRGWGERRKHYMFSLAAYETTRTGSKWIGTAPSDTSEELWFAPIDWMPLPDAPEAGGRG